MTSIVQSPQIGNALRQALQLDAAGRMPLDFEPTILPVAVVADVRELLTTNFVPMMQSVVQPGVVGDRSFVALEWQIGVDNAPKRLLLDSVILGSGTAAIANWGFFTQSLVDFALYDARRKVGSLQYTASAGRLVRGSVPDTPPNVIQNISGVTLLPAGNSVEIFFREPITLDQEGQAFCIGLSDTAQSLYATFQWREEQQ